MIEGSELPAESLRKPAPAKPGKPWYRQSDFWLGFGLFYIVIIGLGAISRGMAWLLTDKFTGQEAGIAALPLVLNCLPYPVLLGLGAYLKPKRPWVAFGIVIGIASLLLLPIILGVLSLVVCFATTLAP